MLITTAQKALETVKSGDKIFIHSVSAVPHYLVNALVARADSLKGIEIYHLHTEGEAPYTNIEYAEVFHTNAFFIAKNTRKAIAEGRGSYIPVFLSEIPKLFSQNIIKLNIVLISVSVPDKSGFCSLGTSVDATLAAIDSADVVIAQINKFVPRTIGDSQIHTNRIDYFVPFDEPLQEVSWGEPSDEHKRIGSHVASLVEDGATLQMGIGSIPNAALSKLKNHKDLGLHTEMFSDGIIDLIENDVINCNYKGTLRGRVLATFLIGSKRLYEFVNDNPFIEMKESSMVNDTARIRKNPNMIAINSAIEVDLTGQVCADSIGPQMYSGVGGQMDFIRGASLSPGGKAIIALPSTTKRGESRIVPFLKQGAGVVTTRAHIHYVITENGIADLYGKTLRQRAAELAASN
jgi:acyl-CoA hydrolase